MPPARIGFPNARHRPAVIALEKNRGGDRQAFEHNDRIRIEHDAKEQGVKTVLFLCTGNYYRSRFAEELFNHGAESDRLDWVAQSRGLALERGTLNVGPISPFTLYALTEMAVSARGGDRFPQQCSADDLVNADLVIAVKEAEHRPLMRERFADWEHRLDYWHIHDVEDASPAEALKLLADEVRSLLVRLRNAAPTELARRSVAGR
jgi:low molecular weight protein-tyrosine phosphatase